VCFEPLKHFGLAEADYAPELETGKLVGLEPVEYRRRRERQAIGELGRGQETLAHADARFGGRIGP